MIYSITLNLRRVCKNKVPFGSFATRNITKNLILKSWRVYDKETKRGLLLGAYPDCEDTIKLTKAAKKFSKDSKGKLEAYLKTDGIKEGKVRLFNNLSDFDVVAVVGIRKSSDFNLQKENVRIAAGIGVRSLLDVDCTSIEYEDFGDPDSTAEGFMLSTYTYNKCNVRAFYPGKSPYNHTGEPVHYRGITTGRAQGSCMLLIEAIKNLSTPTKCAEAVEAHFKESIRQEPKLKACKLHVRDKKWADKMKMGALLSVTRDSPDPLKFLEVHYKEGGKNAPNYVLIGKGVTFDSGGISLKPSSKKDMQTDMSGVGAVAATILGLADLSVEINAIGLIPLCQSKPGSRKATKPGDIVTAMNGKSILVLNTDAEDLLILADALCYADKFQPKTTVDVANLTSAMRTATGGVVSGVFTNSTSLWNQIESAGAYTGDHVWRFPLYEAYSKRVTDFENVDVSNMGKGVGGEACNAAAFLKEFAPEGGDWMHIDFAGAESNSDIPYLMWEGQSGRPTRTILRFFEQLAKAKDAK